MTPLRPGAGVGAAPSARSGTSWLTAPVAAAAVVLSSATRSGACDRGTSAVRIAVVAPILTAMICTSLMSAPPGARSNTTAGELDRRSESTSLGCSGTATNPNSDREAAVNADPLGTATTFCPGAVTYPVDETVVLRQGDSQGDKLVGPVSDAGDGGMAGMSENCPNVAGPGQKDPEGNGTGDACDPDEDGVGKPTGTNDAADGPTMQDRPWCPDAGTHIFPGQDIGAKINGSDATWCVHAGTYAVDQTVTVAQGDNIYSEPGIEKDIVLPNGKVVHDRTAAVRLTNAGDLPRLVNITADSAVIDWLGGGGAASQYVPLDGPECINPSEETSRCAKNGTGMFMGAGSGGPGVVLSNLDISGNAANCIAGLRGRLVDSELSDCSRDDTYDGFSSAAVKTAYESEYVRNYVHDTGSNGLWCDQGCHDVEARSHGFWAHDNLIVNNDGWGVRYEFSPMVAEGIHATSPSALVENNFIAHNGIGGASMADAQNGIFRNNRFGPQTVGGVAYGADGNDGLAILFEDSGRATRTDLHNGEALTNTLNGEIIKGCELPDVVVYCHDNTGGGSPWLRRASIAALVATAVLYTIHRTRLLITDRRVTPAGPDWKSRNSQEEDG